MSRPIFPNDAELDVIANLFPLAKRRRVARMTFPHRGPGLRKTGEPLGQGFRSKNCGCVVDSLLDNMRLLTEDMLAGEGLILVGDALRALDKPDSAENRRALSLLFLLNDNGKLQTTAAVRRALLRPGE